MQTNLNNEVEWLRTTHATAAWVGFEYASQYASQSAAALRAGDKRVTFDFETNAEKVSRNGARASLGEIGTIELEMFRKSESPRRPSGMLFLSLSVWYYDSYSCSRCCS
jgi:hypothetical protein